MTLALITRAMTSAAKKTEQTFSRDFDEMSMISNLSTRLTYAKKSIKRAFEIAAKTLNDRHPDIAIYSALELSSSQVLNSDSCFLLSFSGFENFLNNSPHCAFSVTYIENSKSLSSIVFNPIAQTFYEATYAEGVQKNGKRAVLKSGSDFKFSLIPTTPQGFAWLSTTLSKLQQAPFTLPQYRISGSILIDFCDFCTGSYHLCAAPISWIDQIVLMPFMSETLAHSHLSQHKGSIDGLPNKALPLVAVTPEIFQSSLYNSFLKELKLYN